MLTHYPITNPWVTRPARLSETFSTSHLLEAELVKGSVSSFFPASDLRSCRLSASKHKVCNHLDFLICTRSMKTVLNVDIADTFYINDMSLISVTKQLYLRVGQCQMGFGEGLNSGQSTLGCRLDLDNLEELGYLQERITEVFWRAA